MHLPLDPETPGLIALLASKVDAGQVWNGVAIAVLTAGVTTFSTVKVLESEISSIHRELQRHEQELKAAGSRASEIELRQAKALAERAGLIEGLEHRVTRLESRK